MAHMYNFSYTRCPFGKYKGRFLKEIPDDYVKWAVMNHTDRGICEMFSHELQRRYPAMKKPINEKAQQKTA